MSETTKIQTESNDVGISELENTTEIEDSALFIIEDSQNTKTATLAAVRKNLIQDDEIPSDNKIYSSEKIDSLLSNYEKKINGELAETNSEVSDIKTKYAKTNEVNAKVKDIKDNMFTKEDKTDLEKMIELKRSSSDLISGEELDTSSEISKIHMKHLGEDVLEAITGQATVTLTKAPVGGWTTEAIANKSVTADKLSSMYRFRSEISECTIDEITDEGIYLIGNNVDGVPKMNEDDEEQKVLYVTVYGKNKQFIEQKVCYCHMVENRPHFIRRGKTTAIPTVKFTQVWDVSNKFKLGVSLFGDELTNRGVINAGEDIYDHVAEGSYKAMPGAVHAPTTNDTYFIKITKHDDYYVYEAYLESTTSCVVYISYSHPNEYGIITTTEWFKIINQNRSKFDGQRIHLFGDGICYGNMTSTDPDQYSYPRLLFEKYGFKVFNHAINDATIGNYNVKTIEERSVLTQIQSTTFQDDDFVVIFAGTNDYRNGNCPIGNNTDLKDTTFKGSINLAIKKLMESNKSLRVLLVTPIFRARTDSGDGRNSDEYPVNSKYLVEYVNAMVEAGKSAHIPVLNMYESGLINKYNAEYWLDDGLYFSKAGQAMFATRLFDELSRLY